MQLTTGVRHAPGLLVLMALASSARADDRWTQPYPGVRYLERTTTDPAERVFAVVADLSRPDLALRATRPAERGRTVSAFAALAGLEVAINGDFFQPDFTTEGLAMGAGEPWPGSSDGSKWSFVAAGAGNRVEIPLPEIAGVAEPWMSEIVGGTPLVVDQGAVTAATACDTSFCRRNPRTAVGLSRDGRTLFLVVVDGRSAASAGMSLAELGRLLVDLGAWRALNLDGGGSSAMVIGAEGGVVNVPSDGAERRVANHLGLRLLAAADAGAADAAPAAVGADAAPVAGRADAGVASLDAEVAGGCSVARDGGHLLALLLVGAWLLGRKVLS